MVLHDRTILIIEDNIMLALDLAYVVEDQGGRAIGPVTTAAEALQILDTEDIAAAVLDCQIADDDVAQIVMCLAERGIPVVVTTITEPPPLIATLLPEAPVLRAPIESDLALTRLSQQLAKRARNKVGHLK
jgi:DNA-binding NtrC family response regulator